MKWGKHTRDFRGIMSLFQDGGVDLTDRGRAKLRYRKCRKIDFFGLHGSARPTVRNQI